MLFRENTLSPCKRICILDENKRLCKTCFRTLSEISNWGNFNKKQKLEIFEKINTRRNAAKQLLKTI
jgi:predicted Fe-S protein YdhL (DUF1289 family)